MLSLVPTKYDALLQQSINNIRTSCRKYQLISRYILSYKLYRRCYVVFTTYCALAHIKIFLDDHIHNFVEGLLCKCSMECHILCIYHTHPTSHYHVVNYIILYIIRSCAIIIDVRCSRIPFHRQNKYLLKPTTAPNKEL